ncbi:sigma-70 family RNA polymerase sigma factor [Streptomyces flavotricini]|uniref:Sigma-70 family RNA polymerase sigma factor n=1 Tax=Streptomyces flavotricini TaxID=66888 RepID=A0ABS8EI12_9ACTN|nr:sigma-70 family RNA polymerase sigma factor [Streptomyces flavotricini]MCC0100741.1 sigma-70 family RNA polymerase sigma factor [Streptomyces flavotricini]
MASDSQLLIDGHFQDPTTIELRDFAEFYKSMAPKVYWTIRNTLGRQYIEGGNAEDIAQQVWETILKNWERVGRLTSPEAYVRVVASNHAKRAQAHRNAELAVGEITAPYFAHLSVPGPETRIETRFEALEILHTLNTVLAPRQKQVIVLRADGYSDQDIAAALNITTESVRSHRRHARNRLAHHLGLPGYQHAF